MADQDPFSPVFVLPLDGTAERRAAFIHRQETSKVSWRFLDVQNGLAPGLRYDAHAVTRKAGRQLTKLEVRRYSSHYAAWQEMLDRNIRQCIVLEDDSIVDWAFLSVLAGTDLAALGIPYLRLCAMKPAAHRIVQQHFLQRSRSLVEYLGYPGGTQGYVITIAGARLFLETCAVIRRPLDQQMDRSWDHGIANLSLHPAPVMREFSVSPPPRRRVSSRHFLSQRFDRWIDRQKIRAMRLGLLQARSTFRGSSDTFAD